MEWIYKADDPMIETLISCVIIFCVIIALTRIVGLRSFAKFTAYDFAFTVAIGSIISSILTSSTTIFHGGIAIAGLLAITYLISLLQRKSEKLNAVISNAPLLLMDENEILYDNLRYARIEKKQLYAKLREANVLNRDQVCAVILESTGDISVLHKSAASPDDVFDRDLLLGVKSNP